MSHICIGNGLNIIFSLTCLTLCCLLIITKKTCNKSQPSISLEDFSIITTGGITSNGAYVSDLVEVISLRPSGLKCNLPNLPFTFYGGVAFIPSDGSVMVCGGLKNNTPSKTCYKLQNLKWSIASPMNNPRSNFDLLEGSSQKNDTKFYAINGDMTKDIISVEYYHNDKWMMAEFDLPEKLRYFCVAWKDSNTILVSGGDDILADDHNYYTYFFDFETKLWRRTERINRAIGGSGQKCGRIITSRNPVTEYGVLMTGGYSSMTFLMAPRSIDWIESISFPTIIGQHQLIEEPFGGLIVVGGLDDFYSRDNGNSIFYAADIDSGWITLTVKNQRNLRDASAILVFTEKLNCWNYTF